MFTETHIAEKQNKRDLCCMFMAAVLISYIVESGVAQQYEREFAVSFLYQHIIFVSPFNTSHSNKMVWLTDTWIYFYSMENLKTNIAAEDRGSFHFKWPFIYLLTLSIVFNTFLNETLQIKCTCLRMTPSSHSIRFKNVHLMLHSLVYNNFFICSFSLLHFSFWNYSFQVTAAVSWDNVTENFRVDCTWVCQAM